MLLAADAAGALSAGVILESRGFAAGPASYRLRPRDAVVPCNRRFAVCTNYALALVLLFAVASSNCSFNAMARPWSSCARRRPIAAA